MAGGGRRQLVQVAVLEADPEGQPAIGDARRREQTGCYAGGAQVVLRWQLQRGEIIFPKSTSRSRIEENFALFDFELSDEQVAAITALNRNERIGPNPDA